MAHLDEPQQVDVDAWLRLQLIVRKLPVLSDKEWFVPQAALIMAVPENAQQRPRGDKAAIRELSKLAKHLTSAMDCYQNLPAEASHSLYEVPPGPEVGLDIGDWQLMTILAGLREQTLLAKTHLDAKPVKKGGGRPPDHRATDVAIRALGCYEFLTGEKAGVSTREVQTAGYEGGSKYERGGPFVRFLPTFMRNSESTPM